MWHSKVALSKIILVGRGTHRESSCIDIRLNKQLFYKQISKHLYETGQGTGSLKIPFLRDPKLTKNIFLQKGLDNF